MGFGILLVASVAVWALLTAMEAQSAARRSAPPAATVQENVCQCTHAAVFHDKNGCRCQTSFLIEKTFVQTRVTGEPIFNSRWGTEPCQCTGYRSRN